MAAGISSRIEAGTTLTVGAPPAIQSDDLLLALIDADEAAGPPTLVGPSGWTLVPGFPLHNVASATAPSHGTWIFHKVVADGDAPAAAFELASPTAAHGVIVAYRGVDTGAPIHDKSAYGFYGSGDTNGYGSGNTTLLHGLQVNLVATGVTAHATYTLVKTSSDIHERFNSGESPNGLNLVIHDQPILSFGTFSIFTGVAIRNFKSPSASSDTFLFSGTSLVLKPR